MGSTTVSWSDTATSGKTVTNGISASKWGIGANRSAALSEGKTLSNGNMENDTSSTTVSFADCAFKSPEIKKSYTFVASSASVKVT